MPTSTEKEADTIWYLVPELASPFKFEKEKLEKELDIAAHARREGRENKPRSTNQRPDLTEAKIIGRCQQGLLSLRDYTLKKLDVLDSFLIKIQREEVDRNVAIADSITHELVKCLVSAKEKLIGLRMDERRYLRDLNYFGSTRIRVGSFGHILEGWQHAGEDFQPPGKRYDASSNRGGRVQVGIRKSCQICALLHMHQTSETTGPNHHGHPFLTHTNPR